MNLKFGLSAIFMENQLEQKKLFSENLEKKEGKEDDFLNRIALMEAFFEKSAGNVPVVRDIFRLALIGWVSEREGDREYVDRKKEEYKQKYSWQEMLYIILTNSMNRRNLEQGLSNEEHVAADERTKAGLAEVRKKLGINAEQEENKK